MDVYMLKFICLCKDALGAYMMCVLCNHVCLLCVSMHLGGVYVSMCTEYLY